jgi:MHS family citrate/tricarballylate:H+ symporter-like MFS transporter
MPARVRTASFSLAYSLATALFGGFTPAVSTWLIERTHDKAAPAYWLMGAALCGVTATLMISARPSGEPVAVQTVTPP